MNANLRRSFAVGVQMSYLLLLALYSYFMMVELRPRQPTIYEYIVWVWSATLWLEEFRQVSCGLIIAIIFRLICNEQTMHS